MTTTTKPASKTYYCEGGIGEKVYFRIRTMLADRLVIPGPVTTNEVWQIAATDYSYVVLAMAFKNIMIDMACRGQATFIRSGYWYIGDVPAGELERSYKSNTQAERPRPVPKNRVFPAYTKPAPAPDPETGSIYFEGKCVGVSIFKSVPKVRAMSIGPWYSKVYQRWINL